MRNFKFSEKGVGLVSPSYFVHNFSRKMFLMLHSINWPNFIVPLPLFLEILGNMCITIVCWSGFDVIKSEINLVFLISRFATWPKSQEKKLKYLENEKSFWGGIKSIFYHFWRAFSCHKLSLTWECAFEITFSTNQRVTFPFDHSESDTLRYVSFTIFKSLRYKQS